MKKADFIETIKNFPEDIKILVDGSEEFIMEQSFDGDDKFINLIKQG